MKNCLFYFLLIFLGLSSCQQESTSTKEVENKTSEKSTIAEPTKKPLPKSCGQNAEIYPPSPFPTLLEKLTTSPYRYVVKSTETITAKESLLFKGILNANTRLQYKKEKILEPLPLEGLLGIKKAFIKGKVAISANTFPRADIEEWEFQSPACVEKVLTYIKDLKKKTSWDIISKSPMDYWKVDNRLYFLVPGGFYMLEEAKEIQKILQEI